MKKTASGYGVRIDPIYKTAKFHAGMDFSANLTAQFYSSQSLMNVCNSSEYAGDMMLKLFHVDIESFAVAGAFVIFLMSLEMILDIEIFKNQGPIKEATLVPLVFPLLAGAGAFTTLLSLRAEYASVNIIIALVLNMIWVYFVVSMTGRVERFLGKGGIYIIRKFFGIILLAISVRLFTANITLLIEALQNH